MSQRSPRFPFRYEPSGDSDGEHVGIDHFVLDADGDEMACPPTEEIGLLFAAAPQLQAATESLVVAIEDMAAARAALLDSLIDDDDDDMGRALADVRDVLLLFSSLARKARLAGPEPIAGDGVDAPPRRP